MNNMKFIVYSSTYLLFLFLILIGLASCSDSERNSNPSGIVINEIMPSNRTGLLNDNGKTSDWIELKNISGDTINLKKCELAVIKTMAENKDNGVSKNNKDKEEKKEKVSRWKFPDVTIAPGECLVVFAEKQKKQKKSKDEEDSEDEEDEDEAKDEWKPGQSLTANFKLPKDGATLQFLAPNGKVVHEVKYGKLDPDHAYALQSDSTYSTTYWQSPGFENNKEGYEAASIKFESQRKDPLKIWELMSRAGHSESNWVELKNAGNAPIDLSKYSISRKPGKDESWRLPAKTLEPGQIITFRLAGNEANPNAALNAEIKLGNKETLILKKDGKFIDGVNARQTVYGGSIGRRQGQRGFFYFTSPTRNAENGDNGRRFIADAPVFDHKPGIYKKEDSLLLRLKNPGLKVHYTLDGSEPTFNSAIMKDSLLLKKNTVIRAFAEGDSTSIRSDIETSTFLLGVEHDLPVVNISVNNGDLYDFNRGIYAKGPNYEEEWPHYGGNFWQKWTKKAHVELFDDKQGFSADCGLMIFGGFSRFEDKKSFRLKFRHLYGDSEIDYDFFDNGESVALKEIVLRSGSQDWNRCMLRDEFFTSLLKEHSPNLLIQDYRPVALYVNAQYFGLYYIREKIDKHFVERKLNLASNDSIDIVVSKYLEQGSKADYDRLMKFVTVNDMKNPSNYAQVSKQVDLEGLIDYKLGEIYSGNSDVGNIRYVRSSKPGSDNKWHFVFYDLDATWVGFKPEASYYLSVTGEASVNSAHNMLINRLLANKDFRALFLQRLSYHLANTFSTKNATAVFDALVARIRPEMKQNCERWPKLSYQQWEKNIADFREKFKDKPKVMLDDIRRYLSVTDEENKKYFGSLGY